MIPYSNSKVYGPYLRKDGRMHVVVVTNGTKQTVSYPKYLLEITTGSYIEDGLDVHHKNRDFTDNSVENLEIISHVEHVTEHSRKYYGGFYYCFWCTKMIFVSPKQQSQRTSNKRKYIFCNKSCSGKFGRFIQLSAHEETHEVEPVKFGESLPEANPEPSPRKREGVETRRQAP